MKFHSYSDANFRGTLQRLEYTAVNPQGETIKKYANVYLPYGYDPSKPYDVLYVIHGGGGSPDAFLDSCPMKNMLDHSFTDPQVKPCIVVFPTYYTEDQSKHRTQGVPVHFENSQILFFQQEIRNFLIPKVETTFSTYLTEATEEAMRSTRNHRAITGFSMGGGTTWYAFLENMDLFATFLPLSGDCWIIESKGGGSQTQKTVETMNEIVKKKGFGKDDFRIYAGTGSADIAYPALTPMIEEMKLHTDLYEYSEDFEKGNLHYEVVPDAPHTYIDVYQHLYNFMPYLFK